MSRPAARPIHQRTTECPTCGQPKWRPCVRVQDGPGLLDAIDAHGEAVSPHAARLRAERAQKEEDR